VAAELERSLLRQHAAQERAVDCSTAQDCPRRLRRSGGDGKVSSGAARPLLRGLSTNTENLYAELRRHACVVEPLGLLL